MPSGTQRQSLLGNYLESHLVQPPLNPESQESSSPLLLTPFRTWFHGAHVPISTHCSFLPGPDTRPRWHLGRQSPVRMRSCWGTSPGPGSSPSSRPCWLSLAPASSSVCASCYSRTCSPSSAHSYSGLLHPFLLHPFPVQGSRLAVPEDGARRRGQHVVKRAPGLELKGLSPLSVCPLAVAMLPYLSFPIHIQLIFTRYMLCASLPVDALTFSLKSYREVFLFLLYK